MYLCCQGSLWLAQSCSRCVKSLCLEVEFVMSDNIATLWPCWQRSAEFLVAFGYPETSIILCYEHLSDAMWLYCQFTLLRWIGMVRDSGTDPTWSRLLVLLFQEAWLPLISLVSFSLHPPSWISSSLSLSPLASFTYLYIFSVWRRQMLWSHCTSENGKWSILRLKYIDLSTLFVLLWTSFW
jgi:hypothetical protein